MSVKHKAEAVAVACIDFRFQEDIDKDIENRGFRGKVDNIRVPGAAKNTAVIEAVEKSLALHDPDYALIYEHEDCGAYGEDPLRKRPASPRGESEASNSIQTHKSMPKN